MSYLGAKISNENFVPKVVLISMFLDRKCFMGSLHVMEFGFILM